MVSEKVVTKAILDASFLIHSDLGPGLLEKVYQRITPSIIASLSVI